jgi:hypothetical protein
LPLFVIRDEAKNASSVHPKFLNPPPLRHSTR